MASLTEASAPASGGGKKLMIVIGLLGLVVLLLAGAVGYLFLNKPDPAAVHEAAPAAKHVPVFEKIDTFVVNLGGHDTVLQTELQVELSDEAGREMLKQFMPRIRNNLIMLLSSKTADEVATAEGKARLRGQIRSVINESLAETGRRDVVRSVVFNSFIVQLQ